MSTQGTNRPEPDDQPTTVLPQQTAEQPAVTTAPATRRSRIWSHVPARVGRARTSTVVIGCLFVLLLGLNAALPSDAGETTTVTTSDGQTIQVRNSDLPDDYVPPTVAPSTTAPAPVTTGAPTTSQAPQSSEDDEPATSPSSTTRTPAPSSTAPATTSRVPSTSRAPSTSARPTASEEPDETSSAPTS